jgi:hypothetical protein
MERIKSVESIGLSENTLKVISSVIDSIDDNLIELDASETQEKTELTEIFESLSSYYIDYRENLEHIRTFLLESQQKNLLNQTKVLCTREFVKTLGIWLLKNKIIERPLRSILTIQSPNRQYLQELLPLVYTSEKFNSVLQNISDYYHKILDKEIDEELRKVPITLTPDIIADYRKAFYKEKRPFEEFIKESSPNRTGHVNRNSLVDPSSANLRKEFETALEKKKFEEQKEKQQNQFDNYEKYFHMDERELDRAKRQGDQRRRVISKQTRREKFKK